jgi:serine/threonine-protein kinase
MTMDRERWDRLDALFNEALGVDEARRAALLDRACAGDSALRAQVEAMLRAHDMEVPVLDRGPEVLAGVLDGEPDPQLDRVGPYRVLRELGRGGMGVVYLAERDDADFRQLVAVKCLVPGQATPDLADRFRRERRILASLTHPNIAQLYDGGFTEGELYFVMEYVDGQPLDRYCDEQSLPIGQRLRLFVTVCEAVQYAHQHLIVHRDLKPGNVLVTADGHVKLLDFGIAKLLEEDSAAQVAVTRTARVLTPEYSSPEQIRGEAVTAASDVFSLGLILFGLLTGRRAFVSEPGPLGPMRAVIDMEPARASAIVETTNRAASASGDASSAIGLAAARGTTPDRLRRRLRGDLDTILDRALRKEVSERYASAQALLDDVRCHIDGLPIRARPASRRYLAAKFVHRHRVGVAATAAVALALVAGLTAALWQGRIAARERDLARTEAAKAERVTEFLVNLFGAADPAEARGENPTAREILDRGARRIDAELAGEPAVLATVQRAIGNIYAKLGEYEQARTLIERSLETHRRVLGRDNVEAADDLYALAALPLPASAGLKRDSLYGIVIDMYRRHLGPDDPKYAHALRGRGLVLMVSDTIAADSLIRHAIAIFERNPGHESDLALALNDFGLLNHTRGNYPEAERLYRRSIELQHSSVGEDHPNVLPPMSNLGWVLQLMGRFDAADSILRQTLALRRRVLGERHSLIAATLHGLGEVAFQRGAYAEAEEHFAQALDIRRERTPANSATIADLIQRMASVSAALGRTQEADDRYAEAIRLLEDAGLDDGLAMARVVNNQAILFENAGDRVRAARSYRRAWQIYRSRLGDQHAFTAIVQSNVGHVLMLQDSLATAEPLLRESLAALRQAYSDEHTSVGNVLVDIGRIEMRRGATSDAENTLRRALEIVEKGLPAGHWRIAAARIPLGRCLTLLGRHAEAERLLLDALSSLEPMRDARRLDYTETLIGLEELNNRMGRTDEARRYRTMRTERT